MNVGIGHHGYAQKKVHVMCAYLSHEKNDHRSKENNDCHNKSTKG